MSTPAQSSHSSASTTPTPSSSSDGWLLQSPATTTHQPAAPPVTWPYLLSRIGLPPEQRQLTPEEFIERGAAVFIGPPVHTAIALLPLELYSSLNLFGYSLERNGVPVRLPDLPNGQSRWTGDKFIAESGLIVQRHPAFYAMLSSELQSVPENVRGHELINHLTGQRPSPRVDKICSWGQR